MRLGPIARFVAYACFAIAAASIAPALLAADVEMRLANGFFLSIFVGVGVGALVFAAGLGFERRPVVRSGMRELFLALLIFWGCVPFLAAVPFVMQGFPLHDAWFEAVSALTTTGGWLSDPGAHATGADMIYRASLQWLGGLVSIATAGAVFVRPEFIGVAPLVPPFARGKNGSFIRAFDRAVWTLAPVYGGITLAGFAAFVFTGTPPVDAALRCSAALARGP